MATSSLFFSKEVMDIIDNTSSDGKNCKGCSRVLSDAEKQVQNYCSSCVCINKCTLCGKSGDFAMLQRGACWSCRNPKVKCAGCRYSFDAMALERGKCFTCRTPKTTCDGCKNPFRDFQLEYGCKNPFLDFQLERGKCFTCRTLRSYS